MEVKDVHEMEGIITKLSNDVNEEREHVVIIDYNTDKDVRKEARDVM